jgi:DNA-binding NarL/FixJ family response regulator
MSVRWTDEEVIRLKELWLVAPPGEILISFAPRTWRSIYAKAVSMGFGLRTRGRFTPCQMEVVPFLADGEITKVIAWKLGSSPRTIETHIGEIMRKLGVTSRVRAALLLDRERRPFREEGVSV